jgi:tetratricopeptide (TPR) repeat protein
MKHKKVNIQKQPLQPVSEVSTARKRVYWVIIVLVPFFLLGIVEVGLRIFHYGEVIPLFMSIPDESSKYYGINLNIAKRYFTKLSDIPTPRKDLFLKEKPNNGYRIFVLGESTAAGFPYGNNITFPRILNRRLSDAFPNKYIEVVNTALTAINTYTQLDLMDEILEQKPDAILIYTGHNEYYGALGVGSMESVGKYRWIVKASLALQKMRLFQLLRNTLAGLGLYMSGNISNESESDPSSTLMERIVKKKIIPFSSGDYSAGVYQFRENLAEIIRRAQGAGVKVLVSELVSNIHDIEPFESVEDRTYPSAKKVYADAREYEKQGKFDDAKKAYSEAKDLDALRFRAPEEFNTIIHSIAKVYHIPVIPMKAYFESHSRNGMIGAELMYEHVHPNLDGYFIMANAFFESMRENNFIDAQWDQNHIKTSDEYRAQWGKTTLDSVYASFMILRLKSRWPFNKAQPPALTLEYFNPVTKIDSLAASVLLGIRTLEQEHIELAEYYEKRKDLKKAFDEYRALIYTVPFLDLFYEPAVRVLVEMKAYGQALQLLQELLHYQKTPYVYQWIGQIYLVMHETSKGIIFLEKARQQDPLNSVLLYNLGLAYFTNAQNDKGDEILVQLKKSSSNRSLISDLEKYRKTIISNNHF